MTPQQVEELKEAGYNEYVLPGYGKCRGWYSYDDIFLYGDYRGSYLQEANIQAIREYMNKTDALRIESGIDPDACNEVADFGDKIILIFSLNYNTEKVIFYMPAIAKEHPDFFDKLISVKNHPCLDDEILDEVCEQRITNAWEYCEQGVMQDVYKCGHNNRLDYFNDWYSKVQDCYTSSELLDFFRGYCPEAAEDDGFIDEYIEQETGPNVFFRTKDYRGKFTPPVVRLARLLHVFNMEGVETFVPRPGK